MCSSGLASSLWKWAFCSEDSAFVFVKEDFLTLCSTVLDSLDKDRELSEAQAEIKALKLTERSTEKAYEEV
jgi:hypothetical protein